MNKNDIIRMAREAGLLETSTNGYDVWYPDNLERFAALVASAEREACAKVCDAADKSTHPADLADAIRARGQT
jgi:hypothetical protein